MNAISATPGTITKISTPRPETDDEIITLQLTDKEHDALHQDPKAFINSRVRFAEPVRQVIMQSTHPAQPQSTQAQAAGNTWLALVVHRPASTAVVACVQA